MQLPRLSAKDFRYLAQGTSSILTAGAVIAGVVLAWYAFKTLRGTTPRETKAQ